MITRAQWAEMLGWPLDLRAPTTKVQAAVVIDAKALFDAVNNDSVQAGGFNLKDKDTALELQGICENLHKQETGATVTLS